nr:hypothetical protein CFP56_58848 [Quercus suber]
MCCPFPPLDQPYYDQFIEVHEGTSKNEDDHELGDDATHINVTRNEFKELLDTMGKHEDFDGVEEVLAEENRDTCFGPDPTLE